MKLSIKTLKMTPVLLALTLAGCAGSAPSGSSTEVRKSGSFSGSINYDTVKAQRFDTGRMWTFDNPPVDYFEKTYGFRPSQQWLDDVRKSALRFSTYCSASFVSEDGLVMTNHHCGRESVQEVTREGEDLAANGFFAPTLADERKVPGLFVDQLVLLRDVTKQVQDAIAAAQSDEQKVQAEKDIIKKIESDAKNEPGVSKVSVVKLYQGGQYSLYGYKRYNDVRLVFSPENQLGYYGGDYDNFTYPRYNLDFNFFRVYDENGKPLKTKNYFKWSQNGAREGEAVFVVGNPGRTNRLNTVDQLEYYRDVQYPMGLASINSTIGIYEELIKERPAEKGKLMTRLFSLTNSRKVYEGMIKGLQDPMLMARKVDFEKNFRAAVMKDSRLNAKYGKVWDAIAEAKDTQRKYARERAVLTVNPYGSAEYFLVANDVLLMAERVMLPPERREGKYQPDSLENTKAKLFPTDADFDAARENKVMLAFVKNLVNYLGEDHEAVKLLIGDKRGQEAVDYLLKTSPLTDRQKLQEFLKRPAEEILKSNDPILAFVRYANKRMEEITPLLKEASAREQANSQMLGQALFEVYGHSIPPDATFTLRISDGVVKGYDYNGTIAPVKTTYHGLYERYYAFGKNDVFDLPEKWKSPPSEFQLETPMNFISTNDIIGGNSGSPVINKNAEIVGLAFDGNIESLPGNFIFTTEANRTVSVDSEGMVEAIQDMYKAKRLSDELQSGHIPAEFNK